MQVVKYLLQSLENTENLKGFFSFWLGLFCMEMFTFVNASFSCFRKNLFWNIETQLAEDDKY